MSDGMDVLRSRVKRQREEDMLWTVLRSIRNGSKPVAYPPCPHGVGDSLLCVECFPVHDPDEVRP